MVAQLVGKTPSLMPWPPKPDTTLLTDFSWSVLRVGTRKLFDRCLAEVSNENSS
ncbi:hypothetical protein D3C87_1785200 [compost metagenome]